MPEESKKIIERIKVQFGTVTAFAAKMGVHRNNIYAALSYDLRLHKLKKKIIRTLEKREARSEQ